MPRNYSRLQLRSPGFIRLAFAAVLLFSLPCLFAAPAAPAPPIREDRILIQPRPARVGELANFHANGRVKIRKTLSRLGGIEILELPAGADARSVLDRYRRSGLVLAAEPDYRRWQPSATPNEPTYAAGVLWHLNNPGASGGVPGADIDAAAAWDVASSASNIIVAVVDTGVRYTHVDLAANMWINPGESGGGKETNGIDDDGNGYIDDVHGIDAVTAIPASNGNPMDDWFGHGHGTHVAGILGAVGNNGTGVCGVAWSVQIMACKFISTTAGSDSDLIECLDYSVARGAKVINASIVAPGPASTILSNAMWNVRQAGVVVCAAAGNSGSDNDVTPYYPAGFRFDNILAVTATTRTDGWAGYNYGSNTVHLGAPGYEILSTGRSSDSDYFNNYGTSMATPCVSGAAALLRAQFPQETCQQVIARLLNSVDPLPSLAGKCTTGGRLNLRRAMDPTTMLIYTLTNSLYDWIPTNGMTRLGFATSDGVSGPVSLGFEFPVCGHGYSQIWIGANGLLGFTNTALTMGVNYDLPLTNQPNSVICPFWDDLNPLTGGGVWFGCVGTAPNRKAVASWVAVPHQSTAGGGATFTFQAVLHESGHISFQYQQVESGSTTLKQGKSATIGVEDATGLFGTRYAYNGAPALLTNQQALLFSPLMPMHPAPGLRLVSGALPGQMQLQMSAEPGQPGMIYTSTDLVSWSLLSSNMVPASGLRTCLDSNTVAPQKFYRAVTGPFLP